MARILRDVFKKVFDINDMHNPSDLDGLKASFEADGIVVIDLKQKVCQRKVVGDMVQQIFGQLPYSEEYLLKLRSADGRLLHVRDPEHREAITTELLRANLSSENLEFITAAAPPHKQFGAPCTPQSFHNEWSNELRQDPDIYRVAKKLLGKKRLYCPLNRSIFKLPKQGEKALLHWDRDPRTVKPDDDKELQGKVCFTEGTFVCVLGSHTQEFLGEFCALYDPLYPGRKLGLPKYGLDPNKDPMGLFQRQRAYTVPPGCLVLWASALLHGHAVQGREECISIGCYLGFKTSISEEERKVCQELYRDGAVPEFWPSRDKVHFFPLKYTNFPHLMECMVRKKLSAEARAELVTTRVTKAGKQVLDIRPWGWTEELPHKPFKFTALGECLTGLRQWEEETASKKRRLG